MSTITCLMGVAVFGAVETVSADAWLAVFSVGTGAQKTVEESANSPAGASSDRLITAASLSAAKVPWRAVMASEGDAAVSGAQNRRCSTRQFRGNHEAFARAYAPTAFNRGSQEAVRDSMALMIEPRTAAIGSVVFICGSPMPVIDSRVVVIKPTMTTSDSDRS